MTDKIKITDEAVGYAKLAGFVGVVCVIVNGLMLGAWWMWLRPTPTPPEPKPAIIIPKEIGVPAGKIIEIPAETSAATVKWKCCACPAKADLVPSPNARNIYFAAQKEGVYQLLAIAIVDGEIATAEAKVIVGTPPVPPDPGPDPPVPPVPPVPPPEPAPIPADGLHVMVVYDPLNMDPSLRNKLHAQEVLAYLDSKGSNWKYWGKDVDASNEADLWKKAFTRAKEKMNVMPWVVVSNGKGGFEGPLPKTKEEILALFKKYGG